MIMDAVPPPCIPLHDCRREDNGEIVGYLDFDDLPSGFKEGDPLYVQYAIKQDEEVEDTRIKILKAAAMADERNREKE